jgi:hypothetical protein
MESQILIYGLPQGETRDYMEQLLATNCRTPADIDAVKSAATSQGWHSFRVTTWNGSPPNFAKTVR